MLFAAIERHAFRGPRPGKPVLARIARSHLDTDDDDPGVARMIDQVEELAKEAFEQRLRELGINEFLDALRAVQVLEPGTDATEWDAITRLAMWKHPRERTAPRHGRPDREPLALDRATRRAAWPRRSLRGRASSRGRCPAMATPRPRASRPRRAHPRPIGARVISEVRSVRDDDDALPAKGIERPSAKPPRPLESLSPASWVRVVAGTRTERIAPLGALDVDRRIELIVQQHPLRALHAIGEVLLARRSGPRGAPLDARAAAVRSSSRLPGAPVRARRWLPAVVRRLWPARPTRVRGRAGGRPLADPRNYRKL